MKTLSRRSWNVGAVTAIAAFLALPATALAADYVLTAPHWGKKQDAAVAAAGGTVNWSHSKAGIASVSSENASFLAAVEANNAFSSAAEDVMVQWQDPTPIEFASDPSQEPFFPFQWNMTAMDAPTAWENSCTGAGVRIAIIDGGIDPTHPDLAPNMDTACSASFVPGQPFNSDTGTFWHGMHVAGIAAGAANGVGITGVAPDATLISVKALHSGSGSFSWIIGAILFASDPAAFGFDNCARADIINMSLGATFFKGDHGTGFGGAGPLLGPLAHAVNYAGSKGTLVISAAGNDGLDLGQAQDITSVPAESGSGIAITATGPEDVFGFLTGTPGDPRRIASYTNYGEGTTYVAAPGGDFGISAQLVVNAPAPIAGFKRASIAQFGPLPSGNTADIALWNDAADTTGDPNDACEGGSDPSVAGKFALIHRGSCSFVSKAAAAQASGAVGMIVSNNNPGLPPIMGGNDPAIVIPSVSILQSDGAAIEGTLQGSSVNASMFNNPNGVLDQVLSSCKAGLCFAVGTSMASPAAAGVAALIKGSNPGISLGALKTRLAQTAEDEGKVGHDQFYGHGFVNAARACGIN